MNNNNEFLAIMLKLQELAYTDSFLLQEVKEEGFFFEIFTQDSNITRIVNEGVYLWVWSEWKNDAAKLEHELKKITTNRIDTWTTDEGFSQYRYNIVIKVQ